MTLEVRVHRLIPRSPVCPQTLAVPPIVIKRSITKPQNLGESIEEGLEQGEEPGKPDDE
jgi:hypothetical protein